MSRRTFLAFLGGTLAAFLACRLAGAESAPEKCVALAVSVGLGVVVAALAAFLDEASR